MPDLWFARRTVTITVSPATVVISASDIAHAIEHEPENFEIPPGSSDRYTLIEITAFPGRSADAKRNLYRTLVQRLGEIAIDPTDVSVVILEPTLESWGVRGGHSAADVDLGFSLDV
jgi:phenylpyruvate tautomerase PptA (4-oxalocrotonate tautomerase family)